MSLSNVFIKAMLMGLLVSLQLDSIVYAQGKQVTVPDSFQLQRASIQDTFLLRIISKYIARRTNTTDEVDFPKKGVVVVIVPKIRSGLSVSYRIRAEYDNHYLLNLWKTHPPLFYTQISGRYVVVCDEWIRTLTPVSLSSQYKAVREFVESGWLDWVTDPADARFELHSSVYTWQPGGN